MRQTLGCTCPDEVFRQIEDNRVSRPDSPHTRSITIGGRLLIYIWDQAEPDRLATGLPAMVHCGIAERDQQGLNRFRAVLAVSDPEQILDRANRIFTEIAGPDDKAHLHVIARAATKNI